MAVSRHPVVAEVHQDPQPRQAHQGADDGPARQLAQQSSHRLAADQLPPALEDDQGVLGLLARHAGGKVRLVVADELQRAAPVALAQPGHARLTDAAVGVVDDGHPPLSAVG